MLIGFGSYGTDPALPPAITGEAIKALAPSDISCAPDASGVQYCAGKAELFDTEKRNRLLMGAAGGAIAGALICYLLTR